MVRRRGPARRSGAGPLTAARRVVVSSDVNARGEPVRLVAALETYVHQVAVLIGVPVEAVAHEVTDTATAYVGLAERLPDLPAGDLMLVWDERLGWYIGVEPHGSVISYLGGHVVPTPAEVARFVADVIAGHHLSEAGTVTPLPDRQALAARMVAVSS
ncbi:DUF6292 family protein [Actinokineospora inagensis]|uniref:DUF6292 family protein n=1 Tax=Actinokineospora inagensis TaxID=103730 RepID=UPI001FE13813|nr:DUF6292 family protein [Actinokineospora inagensis]